MGQASVKPELLPRWLLNSPHTYFTSFLETLVFLRTKLLDQTFVSLRLVSPVKRDSVAELNFYLSFHLSLFASSDSNTQYLLSIIPSYSKTQYPVPVKPTLYYTQRPAPAVVSFHPRVTPSTWSLSLDPYKWPLKQATVKPLHASVTTGITLLLTDLIFISSWLTEKR